MDSVVDTSPSWGSSKRDIELSTDLSVNDSEYHIIESVMVDLVASCDKLAKNFKRKYDM